MAEYNSNPYDINSKQTDSRYLVNENSHGPSQNMTQVVDIINAIGTQNEENSKYLIKNEDIVVIQGPQKLSEQKAKLPTSSNGPNIALRTYKTSQENIKHKKRRPNRFSQPVTYYPGNSYIYPYYYDSSGCYYCCWFNGNCCPCESCHQCFCSYILCDPFPCCNGCTGFHCGCLECLSPCQTFQCVQQNNCQCCQFLPCCSGCQFCSQSCDGTCISALPCCNGCECAQLCQIIPCCNGCECEHLFGCLPCCNDAICNICGCLQGCELCNCLGACGNRFQCLGNCDCGNCDCNGCDCSNIDCNGCDLGGCDLGNCDC